jgi:AAA family ATP:ADP antiporter
LNWGLNAYFQERVNNLDGLPVHLKKAWWKILLKASALLRSPAADDLILASLNHQDQSVVTTAIQAAGATRDPIWVLPLVGLLSEARYRRRVTHELTNYGDELVRLLRGIMKNNPPDVEDARHLPALIKATGNRKFIPLLFKLVNDYYPNDFILRKETYRAFNTLQRKLPKLKISVKRIDDLICRETSIIRTMQKAGELQRKLSGGEGEEILTAREGLNNLLARRQAGNISRLFRLLGLRYAASDIIPIYRALTDKEGKYRASALELLDNLLQPPIRRWVIPVLDRRYKGGTTDGGNSTDAERRSELQAAQVKNFGRLLAGDDARLKLAVIYLIDRLGETGYVPMLTARLKDADERVAEKARMALMHLV